MLAPFFRLYSFRSSSANHKTFDFWPFPLPLLRFLYASGIVYHSAIFNARSIGQNKPYGCMRENHTITYAHTYMYLYDSICNHHATIRNHTQPSHTTIRNYTQQPYIRNLAISFPSAAFSMRQWYSLSSERF